LGQPINQPQLCKRNDTSLDLMEHTPHCILTVTCTHLYVANLILKQLSTLQVSPHFPDMDNRVAPPQVK